MIHAQTADWFVVTQPAAIIDNASATTAAIDTADFDYCEILVMLGATDIALTALKVQHSNASDGSGDAYADITGLVYGTSTNIAGSTSALPSATDDNKIYKFEIDCRKTKRYLDLVVTVGDGSVGGFVAAIARLSRSNYAAITASEAGFADILRI